MWRVTLRGIRAHLGRFALSLLAVAISVAFLSGVLALRGVLRTVFDDVTSQTTVYDLYVQGPRSGAGSGALTRSAIPAALAERARRADGVASAEPLWSGTGLLYDARGDLVGRSGAPTLVFPSLDGPHGPTLVAGREPRGAGEIGVESGFADSAGLRVGDRLRLLLSGSDAPRDVRVSGVYRFGAPLAAVSLVSLDPAVAAREIGESGTVDTIALTLRPGAQASDVRRAVQRQVGSDADVLTRDQVIDETSATLRVGLGFVSTFLLVFAGLALFVSSFIIANTFQMSVRARSREFALLRAVGASSRQVFGTVAAQAAVVGLAGGALGLAGGEGLTLALHRLLDERGLALAGGIPITGPIAGVSLAVGAAVTVVAALAPARSAARIPPVQALRESQGAGAPSLAPRTAVGVALLAIGVAGLVLGARRALDSAGAALGVGALALIVGLVLVTPVVARPVAWTLAWPWRAVLRPHGKLALRNVIRSPRRTSVTAAALTIGVALVSAGVVVSASTRASIGGLVGDQLLADLVVTSADYTSGVPAAAARRVRAVPGVASVNAAVRSGQATLRAPGGASRPGVVARVDPADVGRDFRLPITAGDPDALRAGQAVVAATYAHQQGLQVGDTLRIRGGGDTRDLRVGALASNSLLMANVVLAPRQFDALDLPTTSVSTLFVHVESGADAATVKAAIQRQVRSFRVLQVQTGEEAASSLADQVDQILTILYALVGLSVVIAALGIVNTLILSVAERTRELALIRAVGMSRAGVGAVVTIESVLTALLGATLGIGAGLGLAWALRLYLVDQGLTVFSVPWATLGILAGGAVAIGVLAAIPPAVRAANLPVLQAVADEG